MIYLERVINFEAEKWGFFQILSFKMPFIADVRTLSVNDRK